MRKNGLARKKRSPHDRPAKGDVKQGQVQYHAGLDPAEYGALLLDFGFKLIEHSINEPAKGGRIFWLARALHNREIS
jgi:hypothetical protein